MVPDYVGEGDEALEPKSRAELNHERADRERAYLKRASRLTGSAQLWRPRKLHRRSAWKYLCALDNALRWGCGVRLSKFDRQRRKGLSWEDWPLLTVASDLGSDQLAAHNYLQGKRYNLEELPDASHGAWNDVRRSLKDAGHWPMVEMIMQTTNMPSGPYEEDTRYSQICGCLEQFFKNCKRPEDSPCFMALLPRMVHAHPDLREHKGRAEVASIAFKLYRSSNPFRRKGCKSNMNRFMSVMNVGFESAHEWAMKAHAVILTAMGLDDLTGAARIDQYVLNRMARHDDGSTGASRARGKETVFLFKKK